MGVVTLHLFAVAVDRHLDWQVGDFQSLVNAFTLVGLGWWAPVARSANLAEREAACEESWQERRVSKELVQSKKSLVKVDWQVSQGMGNRED